MLEPKGNKGKSLSGNEGPSNAAVLCTAQVQRGCFCLHTYLKVGETRRKGKKGRHRSPRDVANFCSPVSRIGIGIIVY
jgi:hypothetical protein